MATLCIASFLVILTLFPCSIFGFSSHFDPNLALIGDATVNSKDASFVQLTGDPSKSSGFGFGFGFVFQKLPFKFLPSTSFSTDFSFTISQNNGDGDDDGHGLAFVIVPTDFPSRFSKNLFKQRRFFGVEFDTTLNHVGVNVGGLISVKSRNLSSINLVLGSGKKLHSWVDYDSTSKRVEVRLSEFGSSRPYNPLLVFKVDFGDMWKGKQVLVGLTSSSRSSFQVTSVYSWKFRVRSVPKWLHSHPMDPIKFENEHSSLDKMANKKRFRLLAFLSGFIFTTGCVALVTFVGLFLWVMFGNNNTEVVNAAKSSVHAGDFRYEKVNVIVEDASTHVKN